GGQIPAPASFCRYLKGRSIAMRGSRRRPAPRAPDATAPADCHRCHACSGLLSTTLAKQLPTHIIQPYCMCCSWYHHDTPFVDARRVLEWMDATIAEGEVVTKGGIPWLAQCWRYR